MTKTTKAANHINSSSNGIVKKAPKCTKAKEPPSTALKKALLMTKEQEASIAETITFVIKSKACAKGAKKPPVGSPSRQDVPKSPKKAAKDKCNAHAGKDATAKKTASPTTTKRSIASKEVNSVNNPTTKRQTPADGATNKKSAKRVTKSKSPSARGTKPDNKGEIKDNKPETKQTAPKPKQECVKDKKEEKDKDKSPTRKDKQDKAKAPGKPTKDKKDCEKLVNEKNTADCAEKRAKDKKDAAKSTKKPTVVKVNKTKGDSKKPVSVKLKKVNLKKLDKSSSSIKPPNAIKASVKKDNKSAEASEPPKKDGSKMKIKEEQAEDALAAIPRDAKGEKVEKQASKQTPPKKVINVKANALPKVNPQVLAKKLKAKLKAAPLTSSLKSTVVVKKKNRKAKLVERKPMQQVKSRKLLSIWNGPKRHRVASLNAMAKVHCLYDNEFRGNFDQLEVNVKRELAEKEDKKSKGDDRRARRSSVSPLPTRTLRSVPGLRAVGKMWDMHDTTSSSEDDYPQVVVAPSADKSKRITKTVEKRTATVAKAKKPVVKRRKKEEVVMDLKDMVVRKRMASLNASAILAASYSVEKRSSHRTDSDTETSESEEVFSSDDSSQGEVLKKIEDIKKEEKVDCKVIEQKSKKVAVILNQDTDVTFTGVYMNSTTRSTHHEGYCHIAGMKYRISATSHTQTAATAVATETILQSTTTTTRENENADAAPVKSYTPLDALSNMQPPANAAGALQPHHHHMPPSAPPPAPPSHHHHHHHVAHHAADMGALPRRHGCATSAFTAPPPPGHHHMPPEHGYIQGYYQPAGPLISVHGHSQAPPSLSKTVPLSDASPTSPLLQPPPPSSAGDSSDSEVIITSVTTAKEAIASQPPPPSATTYRLNHYPPPPPQHSAYPAYGPYPSQYYGAPPPPPGPPAYAHHDMCYTSFPPHKYMFRRYLGHPMPPYYQPGSPDLYAQPPNTNQQVVTATSTASGSYQSSSTGPPPPTLMEPYPGPPPTLIETYPPPAHYYQGYGPAPSCYTHSPPARPLNYINATYQACPCPMQSCPKNVHTGPLAGDSKRSNITIAKESMPLPPVALALPLEPASATGPPSPARGSAGMPPPPSPAGATYQPPPPPKQETPEPVATDATCQQLEKRRKARVGKAMVRNTIAQSQQSTMLLMCHDSAASNTILTNVKREAESPKEEATSPDLSRTELKETIETKVEDCEDVILIEEQDSNIKCERPESSDKIVEIENHKKDVTETMLVLPTVSPPSPPPSPPLPVTANVITVAPATSPSPKIAPVNDELLLPCQKTVAENVKVKNMKRKCSITKEVAPVATYSPKKPRLEKSNGSYKDLIKKTQNVVKINNGKRKLITESRTANGLIIRIKRSQKRKSSVTTAAGNKDEGVGKGSKQAKPLTDSNGPQSVKANGTKVIVDPELIENKEPSAKKTLKTKKLRGSVADNNNQLSNLERTIESVVHNLRPPKAQPEPEAVSRVEKVDGERVAKKVSNKVRRLAETSNKVAVRRGHSKPKEVPQAITRAPRRSTQLRWSNGWRWHGEPFDAKVFLNSDEAMVIRKCYPAMVHEEGDIIEPRDCVLLKAGQRKNELPFVAKIAALWENPDDGEMMMSLLWYYRPEHTEQGRRPVDQPDEVFASRHKDSNSVACIEDKCYVLTYNEYCRYRKDLRRLEACVDDVGPCIPQPDPYPRLHRQPPSTLGTSADLVFFCRKVYDFRQKRIIKNPS